MLESIRRFVSQRMAPPAAVSGDGSAAGTSGAPGGGAATPVGGGPTPIQIAACALMLELAHADDEFSEPERLHILGALGRHFALDEKTSRELMELAEQERRQAIDQFQFTRLINESYDLGQKVVLAEVLWGLALADGTIAEHESYFVRKIGNLLDLEPGYLNQARRAAASKGEQA
jgi:uncharacterized tellurite resistance protein B-like protein